MIADQQPPRAAYFIEIKGSPTRATITVLGEVDLACCSDLEACFEEALASDPAVVELEFSAVSFIDLTGVEPIIELQQTCAGRGVTLQLVSSPAVDRVLELLGEVAGADYSRVIDRLRPGNADQIAG
jgi:anti-anti-sigma factor